MSTKVSAVIVCCLILSILHLDDTSAYQATPKTFVDVDSIELVDPLREGFNVILRESFINTYLNAARVPTVYSTIISLKNNGPMSSQVLYREDIPERMLQVDGLSQKAWYYVCIEFENYDRLAGRGNTSTSCRVARTLDSFGHKAESSLVDIKVGIVSSDFMEFQLSVEADFPLELNAYLEHGSAQMQTFILTQAKSLRLIFTDLVPGFNYGRLCTIETPLRSAFSAMGRNIRVPRKYH